MYILIIQWSIISLILIILIHYLYSFFQTTLTIPKIKDLVNRPADAYKEIYQTINHPQVKQNKNNINQQSILKTSNHEASSQNMKDELKSFLNNLNITSSNSQMNNNGMGSMGNAMNHNINATSNNINNMNNISSFEFGNYYSSY